MALTDAGARPAPADPADLEEEALAMFRSSRLYGAALMFAQAWMLRSFRGRDFTLALVCACVTLVLAVIILVDPVAFASFITQLHGIALIVEGLSMLLVLRKVKKA